MKVQSLLSKIADVPGLRALSPAAPLKPSLETIDGYLRAQTLAMAAAKEIAGQIQEGWTEIQAAKLLEVYLRDHGVRGFFHYGFAWFGERARFDGIKNYKQFAPTTRVIQPGEAFILDVAPIVNGYICDIGYSASLGDNPELDRAKVFLNELRDLIPLWVMEGTGVDLWNRVHQAIEQAGYDNIHKKYPFAVLGHRVHESGNGDGVVRILNFGIPSYWSLLSRGLFGQLLSPDYEGSMLGLWAVEPHIGAPGFGAKFEEILWVREDGASWISDGRHDV